MKKFIYYTFIISIIFVSGSIYAKKWGRRKMSGQYSFTASTLFDGSAILAKDTATTKLPSAAGAHSIVGKWKLKRHKQLITIDWPDQAHFEGHIVDQDTVTGTYSDVNANIAYSSLIRITNDVHLFHVHIYRTTKKKVKGSVFFNYKTKKFHKNDYRIVVYSRRTNDVAKIVKDKYKRIKSDLTKFGFFKRRINKGFDIVECYLISKQFDPPDESTDSPALTIDGTNVFAYDWQYPEFKWFDWASTNYY